MLEVMLGAGAVALGAAAVAGVLASRRRGAFARAMQEAAGRLGGRVSTGGAMPELRLELEGRSVTVRPGAHPGVGGARAEVALPEALTPVRLLVAWGVEAPAPGMDHVPVVESPGAHGLDGALLVRADDPVFARRVLAEARLDLVDVGRELAAGAGVELVVRGGHLALGVRAFTPSAALVERLVRAARATAAHVEAAVAGAPALPPGAEAPRRECALCTDLSRPGERWVTCARCDAPYHADCFRQATACVVAGCGGTASKPLGGAAP